MVEVKDTAPQDARDAPKKDGKDVEENKVMAAIGYIGILFLVPLLAAKDSPFAQFHAKQSINLFIIGFIASVITGVVPIIGWIFAPIVGVIWLVLAIIGIVNAANGEQKELPIIGNFKIVK